MTNLFLCFVVNDGFRAQKHLLFDNDDIAHSMFRMFNHLFSLHCMQTSYFIYIFSDINSFQYSSLYVCVNTA